MTPRTGRPPSDDAKVNQYRIRLTDEELEKLGYCSKALNKTKADIIRDGIEETYQKIKK